ncbi:hypothetical protein [Patulibacter minatonensis]|uniref:hypothetical protein n=1 Tax=Patulibacter minatonensis TaxID=298163 RepID=UPI00047E6879|nr:hypothetical protein [Patulibacter minatonensis]
MSLISPANAIRFLGAGRIVFGIAMIAVPEKVGQSWLGAGGTTPEAGVAIRAVGIRDALIGMALVHTATDPQRGYRWARTSSFGDITDLLATLAAAKALPRSGVIGTVAMAGAAAASSIAVSEWVRREEA